MTEVFPKRSRDRIKTRNRAESFRQAGKGDSPRTSPNDTRYRKNFDAAFNKCPTHPKYKGKRAPTADCAVCRRLWKEWELGLSPRPSSQVHEESNMNTFTAPVRSFSRIEIALLNSLIVEHGNNLGQRQLATQIVTVGSELSSNEQGAVRDADLNSRTFASVYGRIRRQWGALNTIGTSRMPAAV